MAKKKDNTIVVENTPSLEIPKKRKKGKIFLIILVLMIIIASLGFVFRKQINQYLSPYLKKVPIIGTLFEEKQDPYDGRTKEEIVGQLEILQLEYDQLNQKFQDSQDQNETLEQKIKSLETYEIQYQDFITQKQAWDEEIAKTNPNLFIEQFKKMHSETAERIYEEMQSNIQITKEQKQFVNAVAQMDVEQAAKALEILIPTDAELIRFILLGMEQERKSLILSSMESANAATVIKLLSPQVIN